MVPPPVAPPGKCAVHSPPLRRSTTAPGVSQVLRPSLVVKADQISSSEAGTVVSKRRAFSGAACLVTWTRVWAQSGSARREEQETGHNSWLTVQVNHRENKNASANNAGRTPGSCTN